MTIDVSEVSKTLQRFSWPDYMVFLLMLMSCMIIGVYFGWKDHRKHKHHRARRGSEALDYLVGGRKMQVFPVAMSLVASFISGISLLGTSTEIYVYGTQYCYIFIAIVLTGVVLHYVYLPVYHELQLTSTYEYLHQRFDKKLRLFGSVLFVVNTMLWLPIVCYVPALSFNQGGIKAVVWTVHWVGSNAAQQAQIQRFFSLSTLRKARVALWIFIIASIIIKIICVYNGLLLYATYHDCDPLTTKLAKAKDQLMPLLVMRVLGDYPGLPGLFISGIFSAALSSLSTGLNSLAAVTLEDFIKPFFPNLSEATTAKIMRFSVVIYGIISISMVFIVEKLGAVLQLSASLSGMSMGPLLGIFTLGLFFPWINSKSALTGGISSFLIMGFVCFRAQSEIAKGYIDPSAKPTSIDGCDYSFANSSLLMSMTTLQPKTITNTSSSNQLSFYYYSLFGTTLTVLIANLSYLERRFDKRIRLFGSISYLLTSVCTLIFYR
uniref:CSON003951 protein n=1 Tax=Culicoides sonorensis TaxID=179676 RepID=A0A336MMN9_CULSO